MRRRSGFKIILTVAAVTVICALLRLLSVNGIATGLTDFVSREGVAEQLLSLELTAQTFSGTVMSSFFSLRDTSSKSEATELTSVPASEDNTEAFNNQEQMTKPSITENKEDDSGELFYRGEDVTQGIDNSAPLPPDGIVLQNESGLDIDVAGLMKQPLKLKVEPSEPSVLIVHTHGSEAYTQADGDEYEESDPYRTQTKSKSIIHVGDILAEELSARGISVIHDRGTYDYPSYAESYSRTLEAIKGYLEKYPTISLVIDLHRDSQTSSDGSEYKTIAEIGDVRCSQVMLVVGTDVALEHPNWQENMKLALRVQHEMNRSFPTLARPVRVVKYRYNEHVTTGSLLVEVGMAGNTLEESVNAVRFFAEAYANVITAG